MLSLDLLISNFKTGEAMERMINLDMKNDEKQVTDKETDKEERNAKNKKKIDKKDKIMNETKNNDKKITLEKFIEKIEKKSLREKRFNYSTVCYGLPGVCVSK